MSYILDYIDNLDKALFLLLNGLHTPVTDKFWLTITNIPTWIPLYVALLIWIIVYFKKDSIWIILGVILVITFADQFTSGFLKPFFGRFRPCHDPVIGSSAHIVDHCGGLYGFASGHAANSFGLAVYIWLIFRHRFRWIWILLVWAAFVAFSRIMVGVHYPADILFGGIIGTLSGWLIYRLTDFIYFQVKMEPLIKD